MQEDSEKSALTSGNYFEAGKKWCLPQRANPGADDGRLCGGHDGRCWQEGGICSPMALPRCSGWAENQLGGLRGVRAGKGERPGGIGVPRRRGGKCQRQIAHICCTKSEIIHLHSSIPALSSLFYLKSPLGQFCILRTTLRLNDFLPLADN